MAVIRFPRPSTPAAQRAQAEAFARPRSLSHRFAGDPVAAVKWAMGASRAEVDLALTADAVLDLLTVKRSILEAEKSGEHEKAMRLQAAAARIYVEIQNTGKRHRVRGWRP